VRMALDWMQDKGWIRIESGGISIVNQAKYNIRRDDKQIPEGKQTASPPILSSPILSSTSPSLKKEVGAEPKKPVSAPDPLITSWLDSTKHLKTLSNGKHADLWTTLEKAYDQYEWLYFQDEINKADAWIEANPNRKPTQKGLARFMRNWFERAVEMGRKRHGQAQGPGTKRT